MNLLITGAWRHTPEQLKTLEELGHTVTFMQYENDPLPVAYEQIEGVIGNGLFLHHPIEKFVNLKYIQLTSAGLDRVPIDYVKEHHIKLFNAKDVYSIPMAEFALSSVLQIYKQFAFFHDNQQNHLWQKQRNLLELHGKTICILGCGNVGTECAKRFRAFGCHVIGIDKIVRESKVFDQILPPTALKDVVQEAHVLLVTVALTAETNALINAELLSHIKRDCVVVNLSRGAIIDTNALLDAVQNERIFAVLDVFEEEPLPADHPLWNMKNVIITPHNSFVGDGNAARLWAVIYGNLKEN